MALGTSGVAAIAVGAGGVAGTCDCWASRGNAVSSRVTRQQHTMPFHFIGLSAAKRLRPGCSGSLASCLGNLPEYSADYTHPTTSGSVRNFAGPNSFFLSMRPQEPLFSFARECVRFACRPRDTHTVRHLPRQSDGRLQADPVALRHVNRPHSPSRPHHGSNPLSPRPFVHQWRPATRLFPQLAVRTHQQALGAADCRPVQQHSQMACQPKSPRVCVSLPVAKQQIRQFPELSQSRQQRRNLTETQQPGNIGKLQWHHRARPLDLFHLRKTDKSPRSLSPGWRPAIRSSGCGDSSAPASPSAQTPRQVPPPSEAPASGLPLPTLFATPPGLPGPVPAQLSRHASWPTRLTCTPCLSSYNATAAIAVTALRRASVS